MKIWLVGFIAVMSGLSAAWGQTIDPSPPGRGDAPVLEAEEDRGVDSDLEPAPLPLLPREAGRGGRGPRGPRLREIRETIRSYRAEFDLLAREIREQMASLQELREEMAAAGNEREKDVIAREIRRVVEKLSQYEILLAEKKVEIARRAYDRSLDRYVRAQVELEEARRKSGHRLKKLNRALHYGSPPPGGPPPETPGRAARPPEGDEPPPDA